MAESEKARKGRPSSEFAQFPRHTLLQSLKLAQSIHDNNGDQAYSRLSLAESLGFSPESSSFRNLITSSSRYGLTDGGQKSDKLALTNLGLSIVSPRSDEEKSAGLRGALLAPELLNRVYSRFNGHKIPPMDLLANTLVRDFKVSSLDKNVCSDLIIKNATELGILTEIKGSKYLQLDKLSSSTILGDVEEIEDDEGESHDEPELSDSLSSLKFPSNPDLENKNKSSLKPTIFISHSKNIKILDQIKQILSFGEFDFKIAVEQETTAIPIPEKIFGFMRECNCALINVSADEQEKKEDGSYGVNPNVLIEIGGAFLLYDKRVILLVDKRVKLPSNLQGLYRSEYEGDELTWDTGIKLQNTLTQFKELLKGEGVTPTH